MERYLRAIALEDAEDIAEEGTAGAWVEGVSVELEVELVERELRRQLRRRGQELRQGYAGSWEEERMGGTVVLFFVRHLLDGFSGSNRAQSGRTLSRSRCVITLGLLGRHAVTRPSRRIPLRPRWILLVRVGHGLLQQSLVVSPGLDELFVKLGKVLCRALTKVPKPTQLWRPTLLLCVLFDELDELRTDRQRLMIEPLLYVNNPSRFQSKNDANLPKSLHYPLPSACSPS